MDTSLFHFINTTIQHSFLDAVMPFATEKPFVLFAIVAVPMLIKNWKKSAIVLILCSLALAIGDGSANFLKHYFQRPRPCHELEGIRLLVGCGGSFSMPSNHAVNAFSIAATYAHYFRKTALPLFIFAGIIAFSRVYVGVHYPSDIFVGSVWGGVIAGIVIFIQRLALRKSRLNALIE